MAESNLALTQNELRVEGAVEAGYRAVEANWTADQQADLTRALKKCLRLFFTPPVLPNERATHLWSWLRPIQSQTFWSTKTPTAGNTILATITSVVVNIQGGSAFYDTMVGKVLVAYSDDGLDTLIGNVGTIAGVSSSTVTLTSGSTLPTAQYRWGIVADGTYATPDEFGGVRGPMTHSAARGYAKLSKVNENRIREASARALDGYVGVPGAFAIRPRAGFSTSTPMQRWEFLLYPTPDADYVLTYSMYINLDALTVFDGGTTLRYVPGGAPYSNALRAAMLAAVESEIYRTPGGPRYGEFISELVSAVEHDRAFNTPEHIGRMRDPEMTGEEDAVLPRKPRLIFQGTVLG